MQSVLDQLVPGGHEIIVSEFTPCARYYKSMDFLLYLKEDDPYRADRVDDFLTLLWHSSEERLVGLKLKGWRYAFLEIKDMLRLKDGGFLPLMTALAIKLTDLVDQPKLTKIAEERSNERKTQKKIGVRYRQAMLFADGVSLPSHQWELSKAA